MISCSEKRERRLTRRMCAVFTAAVLLMGIVSGCAGQEQVDENARFDAFTQAAFVDSLSESRLDLHYTLQDPAAYGISGVPAVLYRYDMTDVEAEEKELAETRKELLGFRYEALTADRQLDYDVLAWYLDMQISFDGLSLYQEPLVDTGIHMNLPILMAEYRFDEQADIEDYLTLLDDVGPMFDSLLSFEQERSKQGLFMADYSADTVIKALEDFAASGEDNVLVATFEDKLAKLELEAAQQDEYIERNRVAVETMAEAYSGLAQGLRALKGTGENQGGLSNLPKGKQYYEALVALSTGSSRGPAEMDKWLDERFEICQEEIIDLYTSQANLTDELYREWMEADIELADPAEMLEDLRGAIAGDFPPLEEATYQLNTVHPAMQESMSPAFYLTPQLDNEAENPIYINPFHMDDGSNLYLYTTLAHEGFAGHLYQNNYYVRHVSTPLRALLNFVGYSEGWGTYAEMLAYGYAPGLAKEAGEMQRINQEMVLVLYAKADIGIHYHGWTREDLSDYMVKEGFSADYVDEMYEGIVNDPSNYLSYSVGYFEFKELREYAEGELGSAFSPLKFHTVLLRTGPASFDILQDQVEQYVTKEQAKAA